MSKHDLDRLEDEYRALVRSGDPPPAWLTDGARTAFGLRTPATELLVLDRDWAADFGPRELSFAGERVSVEAEVIETGPRSRRLVGMLVPPRATAIEVLQLHQGSLRVARTVEADERGRFMVDDLPAGPTSLRLPPPPGAPAAASTEWTVL
jgi:hypothetical protein